MTLIRSKNSNPCQVCHSGTKGCSSDTQTNLFLCRGEHLDSSFQLVKEDAEWKTYAKTGDKSLPFTTTKTTKKQQPKSEIFKLTPQELSSLLEKLFDGLTLSEHHKAQLADRGLSDSQIVSFKFRSVTYGQRLPVVSGNIPGSTQDGFWYKPSALLIPCFSLLGKIVGYQVAPDDRKEGTPKYFWAAHTDKATKKLINTSHIRFKAGDELVEELPLTCVIDKSATTLYLTEGILKPVVTAAKLGISVLGSAVNFSSCKEQVKRIVQKTAIDKVIFLADAGSSLNSGVIAKIEDAGLLFAQLGLNLEVADWGQLADKELSDPDEISVDTFNSAKTYCYRKLLLNPIGDLEIDSVAQSFVELLKENDTIGTTVAYVHNQPNKEFNPETAPTAFDNKLGDVYNHASGDIESVLATAKENGYKYVLNLSPTGGGKSHFAGLMNEENIGFESMIYLTTQPGLPSTTTIEDNFILHPSRNSVSYVDSTKKTPRGQDYLKRKQDTSLDIPVAGNCSYSDLQLEHHAAGSQVVLCKRCPLAKKCKTEFVAGSHGFLFQKAELEAEPRRRMHPNSMTQKLVDDNTLLIVDEVSATLEFTQQVQLTTKDLPIFEELEFDLHEDFRLVGIAAQIIRGKEKVESQYGMQKHEFQQAYGTHFGLNDIAHDLAKVQAAINEDRAKFGETPIREVKSLICRALSGADNTVSFTVEKGLMTITSVNRRLQNSLQDAGMVYMMDATADIRYLAAFLEVDPTEIFVISQHRGSTENLEIKQITSLGKLGNIARSSALKEKIQLTKDAIKARHSNNIGIVDHKKHANKDEETLTHFVGARGSNAFQDKEAMLVFGTANPHVGSVICDYEVVYQTTVKDTFELAFSQHYNALKQAEQLQTIGRLRSNRRLDCSLTIYFATNTSLAFLKNSGYNVSVVNGADLHPEIATQKETLISSLKTCKNKVTGKESSRELANKLGVNYSVITNLLSRTFKEIGGFKSLIEFCLNWIKTSPELMPFVYHAVICRKNKVASMFQSLLEFYTTSDFPLSNLDTDQFKQTTKNTITELQPAF